MGFIFSRIFNHLFGKGDLRILILGLDNAGKTTLLNRLHLNEVRETVPTVGFNVETVEYKNLKFQVWDLGGQSSIRPYWRAYYPDTSAIIYVIDSCDRDRLEITKQELKLILEEEELKGVCLMILANKQDLKDPLSEGELSEMMGLSEITNRQWAIFKCSAKKGNGIQEGMEWLCNILSGQKNELKI